LLALPVPTMVLAFAPAGMGEMVLTGKVLGPYYSVFPATGFSNAQMHVLPCTVEASLTL
jgi:hypothetical protein